ncbi:MAG TPA: polysaccharide pyruvyl transferase family protein [Pseudosphingobacterium sp.]|nr:polysaccharide pyruvyl transferase family protein [Pseudosphingobacterium sp.]
MKYIYYKSHQGNFGDDLNPWLWPKIFGEIETNAEINFLGIGSVLHQDNKLLQELHPNQRKIIFGTGIRPSHTRLLLDNTWQVKFLRGPMSARYLNYQYKHIADAAYALTQTDDYKQLLATNKKYKISLMPYYKSCLFFDWETIAKELGYHYISPLSELGVEHTLKEIAASELLITEAMHGAILADILRVPWHRFIFSGRVMEGGDVSEFKWTDFLQSIQINYTQDSYIPLYRKTNWNKITDRIPNNFVKAEFFLKGEVKDKLLQTLNNPTDYYLSQDGVLNNIHEMISHEVFSIKRDLTANPSLLF